MIRLTISPVSGRRLQSSGSFDVVTTIIASSAAIADAYAASIDSQVASFTFIPALSLPMTLSVVSASAARTGTSAVYPNPPPPPANIQIGNDATAAQTTSDSSSTGLVVGIVVGLLGLIFLVVGVALVMNFVKGRGTSTVVKAVAVENGISSTSAKADEAGGTELESKI